MSFDFLLSLISHQHDSIRSNQADGKQEFEPIYSINPAALVCNDCIISPASFTFARLAPVSLPNAITLLYTFLKDASEPRVCKLARKTFKVSQAAYLFQSRSTSKRQLGQRSSMAWLVVAFWFFNRWASSNENCLNRQQIIKTLLTRPTVLGSVALAVSLFEAPTASRFKLGLVLGLDIPVHTIQTTTSWTSVKYI
jgi:hypothetical protein